MKSLCKIIKYAVIALFAIVVIGAIYIHYSNILHIVDKIYSPDKNTRQVVYINKINNTNKEAVNIKVYNNGKYNTSISFSGKYDGIFWTSDSSKYAIKTREYISRR